MATDYNHPSWLNRNIYPFEAHFLPLSMGNMHYVDEGSGEVILMIHGTPSWSFLYRDLIKGLCGNYRCIAIDHIGFGLSDKPEKWSYKVWEHTANLEALINHLDLKDITLVVHDFGGLVALPIACKQPERFKRIILFNTWVGSNEDNPVFVKNRKLLESYFTQFLYKYLNVSARWIIKDAAYNKQFLTPEIHRHYLKPFSKPSERMGTLSFLDAYLHENEYFEECAAKLPTIADIPTLILWGMNDRYITKDRLAPWLKLFEGEEVHRIEECGHWVMEEKPKEVLDIIQNWLRNK